MEHCGDIIHRLQSRDVASGRSHAAYIDHYWRYALAVLIFLLAEASTPCSGALAGTWVVVAVEDGEQGRVLVIYFPCLRCLLIGRHFGGHFLEGDTIELVGTIEDAFQYIVYLKILRELALIEIEFCLACSLRVEAVVPSFWFAVETVLLHFLAYVSELFVGFLHSRSPYLVEEIIYGFWSLCHASVEDL